MISDAELLHRYAVENSPDAFAELVRRHIDFVYAAARRQMGGNADLARDATQLVFIDLARKAAAVSRHPVLAGRLTDGMTGGFRTASAGAARLTPTNHTDRE